MGSKSRSARRSKLSFCLALDSRMTKSLATKMSAMMSSRRLRKRPLRADGSALTASILARSSLCFLAKAGHTWKKVEAEEIETLRPSRDFGPLNGTSGHDAQQIPDT